MKIYTTREEAIQAEIINPIEADGITKAGDYDIEAVAASVIDSRTPTIPIGLQPGTEEPEYFSKVSTSELREILETHLRRRDL